jgi:hypothetical protein
MCDGLGHLTLKELGVQSEDLIVAPSRVVLFLSLSFSFFLSLSFSLSLSLSLSLCVCVIYFILLTNVTLYVVLFDFVCFCHSYSQQAITRLKTINSVMTPLHKFRILKV